MNPNVKKWTSMSEGSNNFAMVEDWLFVRRFFLLFNATHATLEV